MKVLITGATGFIGNQLTHACYERGHELSVLGRRPEAARSQFPFLEQAYYWETGAGYPPQEALEWAEAVIHLAGENIAKGPWNKEQKEKIFYSRQKGTQHLMEKIAELAPTQLHTVISASAEGYYGDRGDERLTEYSAPGETFLAEVCRAWEEALFEANTQQSLRKVALRTGLVLGHGGVFEKMKGSFKLGLGATMGSGNQWMSWIHEKDLIRLYLEVLENAQWEGPINAVAPHPVTNHEFTKTFGQALNRPTFLRMPKRIAKILMGDMSELMLASKRVEPYRALEHGFEFHFNTLEEALRDLIQEKAQAA